jgi:hypothetical protein
MALLIQPYNLRSRTCVTVVAFMLRNDCDDAACAELRPGTSELSSGKENSAISRHKAF